MVCKLCAYFHYTWKVKRIIQRERYDGAGVNRKKIPLFIQKQLKIFLIFFLPFSKNSKKQIPAFFLEKWQNVFVYILSPILELTFFFCHFPEKKGIFLLFIPVPSQNSVQLEKEQISFEYPFLQHFPMMCKYIKPPEKSMNRLVIIIIIYYW